MNNKIIVIGDTVDSPYHPLDNITALKDLTDDYELIFTDDYEYFNKLSDYCMCICYVDSWKRPIKNDMVISIKEYFKNGGKMLILHNGISLQDTPMLTEVLGAEFTHHPPYDHLFIKLDGEHPVTEGVSDFPISDEPYHFKIHGKINVFASYEYEGEWLPAAWERKYENGIMLYLMPGHDLSAFQSEAYRKLIVNCIQYLDRKPHPARTPVGT